MTSVPAPLLRTTRAIAVGALLLLAAGCSNGQLVDAGGDRGQGGLAFVLLTVFFWLFFGALFYMDRVGRRRRAAREEQQQDS
jgi:hypothetical protein